MKVLQSLPPGIRKFVLYAICGGSGVVLDFASYSLLVGAGVWYQLANIIGYSLGTCLSFFLNRVITFGVRDAPVRRFLSFVSVAAFGYLISTCLLWVAVEILRLDPVVSKGLTLIAVLVIQFSMNTLITFRTSAGVSKSGRA